VLVPVLGPVTSTRYTDQISVRLVSGQSPKDFADRAEGLAHGFRARQCRVRSAQPGTIVLANCTSDCPPPYNTLNGIFTVSADLEFYPAQRQGHAIPDAVMPLVQLNGSDGVNLPAFLFSPSDQLSTIFTLPLNIEQAYLGRGLRRDSKTTSSGTAAFRII